MKESNEKGRDLFEGLLEVGDEFSEIGRRDEFHRWSFVGIFLLAPEQQQQSSLYQ